MKTRAFTELQSHYLFAEKFGRPGKGNDKGKVEGLVGYARRNFMVPRPRFATWETFNAHLLVQSQKRRERKLRGQQQTIGERFEKDRERLRLNFSTHVLFGDDPARHVSLRKRDAWILFADEPN